MLKHVQIFLFLLLCVPGGINGKRSEKPFRWKESMKRKDTGIKRQDTEKTLVFTYTRKYYRECDCLRSLPTHVKFVQTENLKSYQLFSKSEKEQFKTGSEEFVVNDEELVVNDRSIAELGIFLGEVSEQGAFLVVNEHNQTICDDCFNDRTAVALCQLNGFQTGYRATSLTSNHHDNSRKVSKNKPSKGGQLNMDRYKCFSRIQAGYSPHRETGKRVLNLTTSDQCTLQRYSASDMPCSYNQAAAVFCHNNIQPYLQFYDLIIRTGTERFYIIFQVRYVKNGRILEYFQHSIRSLSVMPKRQDFRAAMCGEKFGIDLQTTQEMGHGRHHTIMGRFLKRCDECVQILFKNISLFEDEKLICRQTKIKNIEDVEEVADCKMDCGDVLGVRNRSQTCKYTCSSQKENINQNSVQNEILDFFQNIG